MPDDLDVPTAPAPLQRYPGLIVGLAFGLLTGFVTLAGAGGLDDGWQWVDAAIILSPVVTGGVVDRLTFSQHQADLMAPRRKQRAAVKESKR